VTTAAMAGSREREGSVGKAKSREKGRMLNGE